MPDKDFYCLHSAMCKALANEKRQRILGVLRDGEYSVSEMADATDMRQSTLSQHLGILRNQGVVVTRREGTRIYYSIANPKIIQAFDLITEVMLETLDSRSNAVGNPAERTSRTRLGGGDGGDSHG